MTVKRVLPILAGLGALYAAWLGFSLLTLPSVSNLADRRHTMTIKVKDWKGRYHPFAVGPRNRYWTPLDAIPAEMKWAVVLAEDANFYKHEGIDVKAIKNAIKYDLEKKSFAKGASTITQQVAKNLYLTREKSISRKVKEVILAKRMEQELTKGRIMELYLNVVELGPMVYGIGHGARYYFGKPASALSPRECAFLAAMLPGPRIAYNPYKNLAKVSKRSDMILRLLRGKRVLDEEEYRVALAEMPNIGGMQRKVDTSIKKEEALPNISSATQVQLPQEKDKTPANAEPAPSPAVPAAVFPGTEQQPAKEEVPVPLQQKPHHEPVEPKK